MNQLILKYYFLLKRRLHCPRNILHINLFASFLLFSTIQLIKELTWVSSVGFPKDVIEVSPKTYEMNPNISVSIKNLIKLL